MLYGNYKSSGKSYLKFALWSLAVETARQIPDFFVPFYPEKNSLYLASIVLQSTASLLFVVALIRVRKPSGSFDRNVCLALSGLICGIAIFQVFEGLPTSTFVWFVVYSPVLIISIALIAYSRRFADPSFRSRRILTVGSIVLLLLRFWQPLVENTSLLDIVYYIEVLIYPFLLGMFVLYESEHAQKRIQELLLERTRTIKELQFVFDNSMDTILITNNVGLLLSWNKRAEEKFGYSTEQAVGKIHIDELFADNYWHQNASEKEEFSATMEAVDGAVFPVTARMQTVDDKKLSRTIYVIQTVNQAKTEN
ncbi:MAG: PAS domain S-box protein [Pseudohongiellaceae bacterium]